MSVSEAEFAEVLVFARQHAIDNIVCWVESCWSPAGTPQEIPDDVYRSAVFLRRWANQ